MKKALILLLLLPFIALSQTTIAKWSGVANNAPSAAPTTLANYVSASNITSSGVSSQGATWNGYQTSGWDTTANANKYIQFSVAPQATGSLSVSSLRFTYQGGLNGVTIKYSTSSTFASSTQVYSATNLDTNNSQKNINVNTSIAVASGQTLYFRVYAFGNTYASWNISNSDDTDSNKPSLQLRGSVTAPAPLNGVYTIGATGANFTTITSAVSLLNTVGVSGPVTFSLKDANYNINTGETFPIVINQYTGASAANTVTFKPAAGVNATVTATNINGYTGVPALFVLKGADYVTFDGSNVAGGTSRNLRLVGNDAVDNNNHTILWIASNGANDGATNITVKNCYIRSNFRNSGSAYNAGIYAGKYSTGNAINTDPAEADNANITITANDFDNLKQGVVINGSTTANKRTTNTIVKANDLGASVSESIICPATFTNVDNFTYTENALYNLYRNTTAGALISAGVYVNGNSTNGTITRNQMKNFTKTVTESYTFGGVVLSSTNANSNILVANNFIANVSAPNNGGAYLNGHGISISGGGGYKIYHNSVVLGTSQTNGSEKGFSAGLYVENATTVDVRNNIFVNNQTNANTRRTAVLLNGNISMVSNLDYNDLYSTDRVGYVGTNATWFENPAYQTSLQGWQSASGKDAHSISYNPAFTSATDLHLNVNNAANNVLKAGTFLTTVTKDIDAQLRNTTTPAIGADEFGTVSFPTTGNGNAGIYCDSSTTWNGTAWSNGAPAAGKDVIFTGNKTISGETFYACSIYVLNGATVEFNNNSTTIVTHSVNVQTTGSLTFRSGSNLIQVENDQNSGLVTIERESGELKRLDYTLWTAPVFDARSTDFQTLKQFSPLTSANRFYTYNTTSGPMGLYGTVDENTTKFALGKGYLIRMPNSSTVSGYNAGTTRIAYTGSFQGTPNNGTIRLALDYTDAAHAYNAIGNPYASPISISDFLNANSEAIEGTVWLWRKTNDRTQTSYSTCNNSGYIANGAAGGNATTGNSRIGDPFAIDAKGSLNTAQGFIVKAKGTSKEVIFRNDMRLQNHSANFFRNANATQGALATDGIDRLWLNISGTEGDFSQVLVAYNPTTTTGYDQGYDSENIGVAGLSLYTTLAVEGVTTQLGIQTRGAFDANDVYGLSFKAETAGTYTINIDNTTGVFSAGQRVYLKDNVEGIVREITENTYTFTTEAGEFANRFTVMYNPSNAALDTEAPVDTVKEVIVYNNNNEIKASASAQIKSVVVYDALGRTLYSNAKVNNTEFASGTINSAKQVVIVNIALENGQTVSKKIMMN
jgi:hypothetical protein